MSRDYICGPCAVGNHQDCNGFLKTSLEFCPCSDRAHHPLVSETTRAQREQNDAIVARALQSWFRRQDEAR